MTKGLGVFELTDRLRRLAYIEEQSIKQLSGWFLRVRAYEHRHTIGYHVWHHAEHTSWIRERLGFLRGGKSSVSLEPSLIRFVDLVMNAPDEYAFIRGSYGVLKSSLLDLYKDTLESADGSANAYDVRMLKRIIPEIEEQLEWADSIATLDPNPERSAEWENSLRGALDEIGGLTVSTNPPSFNPQLEHYTQFQVPEMLIFDERISNEPLTPHDEKIQLPYEDARVEQFKIFFNEIYAAGMLAAVLYDAFSHDMSSDFIYDFSRHFWDECRHSEFGAVRLKELGLEPDRCNQQLFINSLAMPLLHRICYLTLVLEPHYMPRKKPRFKEYEAAGDSRSQLFADHDWSDEINHVRLGKEWLDRLLDGDARSVDQLKEETRALLSQITSEESPALSPF